MARPSFPCLIAALLALVAGPAPAARIQVDVDPSTPAVESIRDVASGDIFSVDVIYLREAEQDAAFDRIDLDILAQNPAIDLLAGTTWLGLTDLAPAHAEDFHAAGLPVMAGDSVTTAVNPPPPLHLGGVRLDAVGGPFATEVDTPARIIRLSFKATNIGDGVIPAEVNIVDTTLFFDGTAVDEGIITMRGVIRVSPAAEQEPAPPGGCCALALLALLALPATVGLMVSSRNRKPD